MKDFAPITQLTMLPYLLVSNPTLPVNSLQELIALAKAKPGQITFASSGNGSGTHLNAALVRVINSNEMNQQLLSQGAEPVGSTPEQFAAFVRREIAKWKTVVEATGATID